ncbi:MaoC family dehydratase [Mycolicibacterium palauense]|uniref:MaoC family dehydratase n=1 Tax=Mycolicibacterium palauense TaxID=2034511 RepID=UPI000BFEC63F|nr:MaoC family dehydratase [Mycolicibacterium palauense]
MPAQNPTHQSRTRCLSPEDFAAPIEDRFFEDYIPGNVYEYGHLEVGEQEIIAFARQYDPQTFHTDPRRAADGPFGGLIASGWHTAALCMRMFVDHYLSHVASMASPGMDELRWPRPVRPGDTLRFRATIDSARVSKSKPDRGLVHTTAELFNQDDQPVMSLKAMNFLRLRSAAT